MVANEKKRNTIYGSIFIYYLCFVFVAEVVLAKPYGENLLMETDAIVAEIVSDYVKDSGTYRRLSGGVSSAPKGKQDEKLSEWIQHYRDRPPTTYLVKFESFPTLVNMEKGGKYESRPFTVGGYNWTFIIYPNGDKRVGADGRISLYVKIDNSTLINDPKDVYAEIKFFIYNKIEDKYYSYHEPEAVRFNLSKPEFGLPGIQFTATVLDPKYGYMFDGEQCVFGVDVFVAQPFEEWEVFSVDQYIPTPYFGWTLGFPIRTEYDTTLPFSYEGRNWVLKLYPNGDGSGKGNSLSLYLLSESNEKSSIRAKLRLINQINSNHVEKQVDGLPNTANHNGWGFEKFVPLADLQDGSKGFVVANRLVVVVEIIGFYKPEVCSKFNSRKEVCDRQKSIPNLTLKKKSVTDATVAEAVSDYVMGSVSGIYRRLSEGVSSASKGKQEEKLSEWIQHWTDRPPTTYLVKFESFPTLVKDGKYESRPFTVGGYNWTFIIYPNGDKRVGANGTVSLYVKIDNSTLINDPKDVYAEIKFFNYNRIPNLYYSHHESEAVKFNLSNPEFGIPSIQSTAVMLVPEYGYIFDGGQCVFGIDVFVAQPFKEWEVFSIDQNIPNPKHRWTIMSFSMMRKDSSTAISFSAGGRNWMMRLYPNGYGSGKDNSLSLYLFSKFNEKDGIRAKLRVIDQINSNHVEKQLNGLPNAANNTGWGFEKFVPLADLEDGSKGLVKNGMLVVEVEFIGFYKIEVHHMLST